MFAGDVDGRKRRAERSVFAYNHPHGTGLRLLSGALLADARFDGLFFVGVRTTGIYCRPVCPARTPRAGSCVFIATAAAAEHAGFRPCLRCRPELAPAGSHPATTPLEQAIFASIRSRAPLGDSVADLATHAGFSARQLRRLTLRAFGVTPVEIVQTERLLFAKKLLQETTLPVSTVALSAGFGSLRRFNALVLARYGMPPSALRRRQPVRAPRGDTLRLRLAYRPPLAWPELLAYLGGRATPGVEWASPGADRYARTIRVNGRTGWVSVRRAVGKSFLIVELPTTFADGLFPILAKLRALFDLDANPTVIDSHLGNDPALAGGVRAHPGLRVPGAWDVFELAVRAVLGQQISVAGATTLAGRLAARFGEAVATPFASLHRLAPTAAALAAADVTDLTALGIVRARAQTLRGLAEAAASGQLRFGPAVTDRDVIDALCRIRGIGEWTAQYVAMRALRFPDAFPAADLGLRKALADAEGKLPSEKQLLARAAAWRPWRAYAAVHLWQSLKKPTPTI